MPDKTFPKWADRPIIKASIVQVEQAIVERGPPVLAVFRSLLEDAFKAGHSYGAAGITLSALGLLSGMMEREQHRRPRTILDEALGAKPRTTTDYPGP